MSTQGLADQTVYALARVREMGDLVESNHPMRHNIRRIKQLAEKLMLDAAQQASDLAWQAADLKSDFDKAMLEAAKP